MKDSDLASSKNGAILHIPVTIGAVAISYNLSQVDASTHLKLTGTVLADIFLGNIKFWDDSAITQLNTGTTLPHQAITVIHRSDGSGTTGIFSHCHSPPSVPTGQRKLALETRSTGQPV